MHMNGNGHPIINLVACATVVFLKIHRGVEANFTEYVQNHFLQDAAGHRFHSIPSFSMFDPWTQIFQI